VGIGPIPGEWSLSGPLFRYETAWRLRIERGFGPMPVHRIKPSHFEDWVADMIEQGLSVSKITESLGVLRRVFGRVARDRAIATHPCPLRAVSLPKRFQTERPVLPPPRWKRSPRQCPTNPIVCWSD
jgi:hypothetical protein